MYQNSFQNSGEGTIKVKSWNQLSNFILFFLGQRSEVSEVTGLIPLLPPAQLIFITNTSLWLWLKSLF